MSRSNSAIIYLIIAVAVLLGGAWGLNQAGILSLGTQQPESTAAANPDVESAQPAQSDQSAELAAAVTETTSSDVQPTSVDTSLPTNASTAAMIKARGKLVVGVRSDFDRFGYLNEQGELVGMDVDIAREFAQRWLGDANKVEFISVNASNRIPKLTSGEIDLLIAAMPHNLNRAELVDFSQTYFLSGYFLVVGADAVVNGLRGLEGQSVGVVQDTPAVSIANDAVANAGLKIKIESFASTNDVLVALQSKTIAGLIAEDETVEAILEQNQELVLVEAPISVEPYAIAIRENESALRSLVNSTLQDMQNDGVYERIFRQWHPDETPLRMETSVGNSVLTLAGLSDIIETPEQSRMDMILERKRIIAGVVVNNPPFVQSQNDGTLSGFDINLLEELGEYWLGDKEALEVNTGELADLMNRLAVGELDIVISGIAMDRKWADLVDFSQPYMGPPVTTNYVGIAVPQNDSYFREQINYVIQSLRKDNEFEGFYVSWFGEGSSEFVIEIIPGDPQNVVISELELALRAEKSTEIDSTRAKSVVGIIRERGNQMIVGVRYDAKPFGFLGESGQVEGFDVDLINAIAQSWGITTTFVQVREADAAEVLSAGGVDLAAPATWINRKELAKIDYSQSYYLGGDGLLVRRYTGITGIADLDGLTIGFPAGIDRGDKVAAYAETNKANVELVPFNEFPAMLNALTAGQVDAVAGDMALLKQAATDNPELAIAGPTYTQEPFGFLLPPADSTFLNLIDSAIQQLKLNGEYDRIYRKWFGEDSTPYAVEIYPGQIDYSFADAPSALDTPVQSKVEQILLNKKIVVGTKYDSAPFGFLDEQGVLAGFDVDIAREFATRWLGNADAIQPVRVNEQNKIELLAGGQIDLLIASTTHTWNRDALVDFSQTYLIEGQRILSHSDNPISSTKDINGLTVGVVTGSSSEKNILDLAQREGITFTIVPFQEYPALFAAVTAGQVDVATDDESILKEAVKQNDALTIVGDYIQQKPQAIGLPNHDKRFRDLVNFTLQEMKQDGTYDRLFTKWFGNKSEPFTVELWEGESYQRNVNLIPMRYIPEGEFILGYDVAGAFPDEGPSAKIKLGAFYIDQYEVTNGQYADCVSAGKCRVPSIPRSVNFASFYGESDFSNYPVIWVTWQDATDYCVYAGKRLPTEAEWEKAARGVDGMIYPWGDATPEKQTNFNYLEKDVTSVGRYPEDESPFGVFDMAGNVREWVNDWYQWDYYQNTPTENPTGARNGVTRVLRGSGWNDTAQQMRLSIRKNFLPDSFDSNLGFRCASTTFPPRVNRTSD